MWKSNYKMRRALTLQELEEELADLEPGNEIDAVIIPPVVDALTDEEDIDDNVLLGEFRRYNREQRRLSIIYF